MLLRNFFKSEAIKKESNCLTIFGKRRAQKELVEPKERVKTFVVKKYITNNGFTDEEILASQKREQNIKFVLGYAIGDNF